MTCCLFHTVRKRHASESQIDDNDANVKPLVKRRRTVSESRNVDFNPLRNQRLEAADETEKSAGRVKRAESRESKSSIHVTDEARNEGTKSAADHLLAIGGTEADSSPRKESDLKRRRKEKRSVCEESDCSKSKRQKADVETSGDQENGADGAVDMAAETEASKSTKKVKISNQRQEMFLSSDQFQTKDELKKKKKKKAKDKSKVKDIPELRVISK